MDKEQVGKELVVSNFSGACITNNKGQMLLQKRSKKEELLGFPGGVVEIGESIEEAMLREVKEETGLNVKTNYLIGVYSKYFCTYPNGDKAQTICYSFKCTVLEGELTIDDKETFDLRFFDINNIPELFTQQHKDMLNDFIQNKVEIFR